MKRTLRAVLMVAAVAGIGQVWGQAPPPPGQGFPPAGVPQRDGAPDQAEHGVARISVMQGEVSLRHGDAGDLSAAVPNAPVLALDRVVTGANSRAELQFDSSNMIRLSSSSEVRIGDLQYKRYLVQIAEGLTTYRALRPNDAQVEISTPSISVRPLGQGTIRVMVNPDGTTEITVRNGDAEAFSPKGSEQLHTGQTMLARGDPADPEFQINAGIPTDDWDRWNAQRDGELQRYSPGARNVNPDIYGTEDLDRNGRWVNDPSYGQVWVPTVDPGWAPYRVGRWVWEDYYGWVWVSGDPWGWAPYHWGRWYVGPYGWAWWPGVGFGPPAYWSPALVGFFGWGGGVGIGVGFGFGFGFGNVGWVPLGPYEAFRPWYGRGLGGVNVINNVNVVNSFRNAHFVNGVNGVTSMRAGEFGRGAVNGSNFVRASAADLRTAGSIQGRMPITPGAGSMRLSDRAVNTAGMPATKANMRFAGRSSFGSSAANVRGAGAGSTANNGGWSRMSPNGAGRTAGSASPAGQGVNRGAGYAGNGGGWRSFNPGASANGGAGNGAGSGARGSEAARTYSNGGNSNAGYGGPAGYRGDRQSTPQSRGATPQQPVRISPPIVSNRGASGGSAQPDVHSGFGGAHSSGSARGGGGGHRGR